MARASPPSAAGQPQSARPPRRARTKPPPRPARSPRRGAMSASSLLEQVRTPPPALPAFLPPLTSTSTPPHASFYPPRPGPGPLGEAAARGLAAGRAAAAAFPSSGPRLHCAAARPGRASRFFPSPTDRSPSLFPQRPKGQGNKGERPGNGAVWRGGSRGEVAAAGSVAAGEGWGGRPGTASGPPGLTLPGGVGKNTTRGLWSPSSCRGWGKFAVKRAFVRW